MKAPQNSYSSLERSHNLVAKAGTLVNNTPRTHTDYSDRDDAVLERASVTLSNFETIWEKQ